VRGPRELGARGYVTRAAGVAGLRRKGCSSHGLGPCRYAYSGPQVGMEGSTWIKAARAGRDRCAGWARDPVRWGTVLTRGFSRRVRPAINKN
jgi:hypothetical protein